MKKWITSILLAITLIFTITPQTIYAEMSSEEISLYNEQAKKQNHEIDMANANMERQYWNSFDYVEKYNEKEFEKQEKDPNYEPQLLDYPDEVEYLEYIPYMEEKKEPTHCNCEEIDQYYIEHSGDYSSYGEYEAIKNNNYDYQSQSYETEPYNIKPKLRISADFAMKKYQGKFKPLSLIHPSIG